MGTAADNAEPLDEARLRQIVRAGEQLDVEFKSDHRRLSDADIVEAVVCLANLPAQYDDGLLLTR